MLEGRPTRQVAHFISGAGVAQLSWQAEMPACGAARPVRVHRVLGARLGPGALPKPWTHASYLRKLSSVVQP